MNKKNKSVPSAGTKAEKELKPKLPTSSQNNAKPHVVRSPNVASGVSKLENKVKVYEWFYSGLESLIKSTNLALNSKEGDVLYLANVKIEGGVNTNKKKEKGSRHSS